MQKYLIDLILKELKEEFPQLILIEQRIQEKNQSNGLKGAAQKTLRFKGQKYIYFEVQVKKYTCKVSLYYPTTLPLKDLLASDIKRRIRYATNKNQELK